MDTKTLISIIKSRFGEYKRNKDWVNVNCPFCILLRPARGTPDSEQKLGINLKTRVYNCFRCESKGPLSSLIPQVDSIGIEAQKVIENKKDSNLEDLPKGVKLSQLKYPWNEIVYPLLLDKGFSPASMEEITYFVEEYKKGNYTFGPCLIFPIYQFGSYRGFQARTVYKNTIPKYIGATNLDRKSILYGFDEAFTQKQRLIITEGFFDKIKVGHRAVATLGKNITDNQLRLIRLGEFKDVVVFLDKDARKEALDTAHKIALYFRTYIATPTKKDPGDMTRTEIQEVLDKKLERVY